jgi:hypothetical protein
MNLLAPLDGDSGAKAAKLLAAAERDAPKAAGSHVRPADSIWRRSAACSRGYSEADGPAPGALTAYLGELFCKLPTAIPRSPPRCMRGDGTVNGFIGALPLPLHRRTNLRGAVWFIDGRRARQRSLCGCVHAQLSAVRRISPELRWVNPVSKAWRKLRGTILPPTASNGCGCSSGGFASMSRRVRSPHRAMRPLAVPVDALPRRARRAAGARESGAQDREIGVKELAELIQRIVAKPHASGLGTTALPHDQDASRSRAMVPSRAP